MAVLTAPSSAPPRPKAPAAWPGDLAFAVALGLTMRLTYWLYGWWRLHVVLPYYPRRFHGDWENLAPTPGSPGYALLAPWEHADALWYKHIALTGYQPGNGSVHFPPLFPLLAHLLLPLFGGSFGFAGMAINFVAAVVAFFLLRRLAALDGRTQDGARAALFICVYPLGFFLFAPFTEAMFLAFTVACLYCARSGRWWWAGLWGFLATLTRWQGALIAAALGVEYLQQVWESRPRPQPRPAALAVPLPGMECACPQPDRERRAPPALAILAVPLPGVAYILYTLYAQYVVREPLSMTQINAYWGIQWLPPWAVLGRGIQFIAINGDGTELLNLLALLGGLLACAAGVRFLRPSLVVYAATQVLFALTHVSAVSPLASAARYMLTVFPMFLLLGRATDNPRLRQAVVLGFAILQGVWVWQFAAGEWVA